jgi:tetratricopeptide (TPR) repeat protein
VAFFVSAEYRLPAVMPLLLFASYAVVQSAAWLAARLRPKPAEGRGRARQAGKAAVRGRAIPAPALLALGLFPVLAWATNATTPPLRMLANTRSAYQNYALAYASRGQQEREEDMLRRSLAADPAAARADMRRVGAEQMIQAGRYADALPELERARAAYLALGRREEATNTANSIGLALERLGRHAEAERVLNEVVAAEPSFAGARVNLALVYEAEGRVPEAVAEYRRALAIDPHDTRPREALERLTHGR